MVVCVFRVLTTQYHLVTSQGRSKIHITSYSTGQCSRQLCHVSSFITKEVIRIVTTIRVYYLCGGTVGML
jgi:hypothetical protein